MSLVAVRTFPQASAEPPTVSVEWPRRLSAPRTARIGGSHMRTRTGTGWWLAHARYVQVGFTQFCGRMSSEPRARRAASGVGREPGDGLLRGGRTVESALTHRDAAVSGCEGRAAAPPGGAVRTLPSRPRCRVQARRPGLPAPLPPRVRARGTHGRTDRRLLQTQPHGLPTLREVAGPQALTRGDGECGLRPRSLGLETPQLPTPPEPTPRGDPRAGHRPESKHESRGRRPQETQAYRAVLPRSTAVRLSGGCWEKALALGPFSGRPRAFWRLEWGLCWGHRTVGTEEPGAIRAGSVPRRGRLLTAARLPGVLQPRALPSSLGGRRSRVHIAGKCVRASVQVDTGGTPPWLGSPGVLDPGRGGPWSGASSAPSHPAPRPCSWRRSMGCREASTMGPSTR